VSHNVIIDNDTGKPIQLIETDNILQHQHPRSPTIFTNRKKHTRTLLWEEV